MALDTAAEINSELTQPVQQPKKDGPWQSLLKFVGMHPKDNLTTTAEANKDKPDINALKKDEASLSEIVNKGDPSWKHPDDVKRLDEIRAQIATAEASQTTQPTPPTPETPPGITQIPVAQPLGESNPTPTVQTHPAEEQKAA